MLGIVAVCWTAPCLAQGLRRLTADPWGSVEALRHGLACLLILCDWRHSICMTEMFLVATPGRLSCNALGSFREERRTHSLKSCSFVMSNKRGEEEGCTREEPPCCASCPGTHAAKLSGRECPGTARLISYRVSSSGTTSCRITSCLLWVNWVRIFAPVKTDPWMVHRYL